jgi:drug/metabolite transporter (DMT)-like permease
MTRADFGVAVAASLAAATAYGIASALQHEQAAVAAKRFSLDPGLLTELARRPVWLLGLAADGAAIAFQGFALRFGPVVLVQPLLIAGLPIAVLLSAGMARRRPTRPELAGVLLCTAGLGLLVPASTTTRHLGRVTGPMAWVVAAGLLVVAVGGLLLLARTRSRAAPLAIGTAAGIATGTGSVLLAVCAAGIDAPAHLLRTPAPYAAAVVGVLALLLTQAAFQTGLISAPLAALSVTEPVTGGVLAVFVLREHLSGAPTALGAGVVGALAAVSGVVMLARSRGGRARPTSVGGERG